MEICSAPGCDTAAVMTSVIGDKPVCEHHFMVGTGSEPPQGILSFARGGFVPGPSPMIVSPRDFPLRRIR